MAHVRRIAIAGCLAMMTSGSAFAQMDFSGEWTVVRAMDNTENPYVGDWFGLPLNEAGLARAEAWDASIQSVPEWQCRPHGWAYIYRGPTALRITKEVDPVSREITAFHAEWQQSSSAPIYLDGRPHPPEHAPHAWNGFSTATWVGDMLKIKTTHLKEDYIRRNGVQISDESTVTTWWIRRGDILTWINVVHDPVYLSEPLIRSGEYRLNPNQLMPTHPCTAADEGRPKGEIPHHPPGKNPFLTEPTSRLGIPDETIWAGAQTMYPEFRAKLRKPGTLTPRAAPPALQNDNPSQNEIHVLPVRGNVYMLVGAGANITASVGRDGVLLVDTGAAQMTDKVLAAARAR